ATFEPPCVAARADCDPGTHRCLPRGTGACRRPGSHDLCGPVPRAVGLRRRARLPEARAEPRHGAPPRALRQAGPLVLAALPARPRAPVRASSLRPGRVSVDEDPELLPARARGDSGVRDRTVRAHARAGTRRGDAVDRAAADALLGARDEREPRV